jgi:hypothetical protein
MEKCYAPSNAMMFATTVLNSSTMVIPWDPGKFNAIMARVAYEYSWRNFPTVSLIWYKIKGQFGPQAYWGVT